MRTAFVQLGSGFPPLEVQMARLQQLKPSSYHVEGTITAQAAQRVVELFERLEPGDEICLFSLSALRLSVGELIQLLTSLVARGVGCLTFEGDESLVEIDFSADLAPALRALAAAHADHAKGFPMSSRTPDNPMHLLTDEEIEDIRRLARAGLTARRIGLIYRRTPDAIHAVLRDDAGAVAAGSHRNSNLRQILSR